MEFKTCTKCGKQKSTVEFYKTNKSVDGFRWWCKTCIIGYSSRWEVEHKEEKSEYNKEYFKAHRLTHYAASAKWEKENKDKVNARKKIYRATHLDKFRGIMKRYKKNHPERNAIDHARRRARKLAAPGYFNKDSLRARISYYGEKCYFCGNDYQAIDHVIPLSRGGSNWPSNLRPICTSCNSSKNNKTLKELTMKNLLNFAMEVK